MGVGWMQQPSARPGKERCETVSGRWRGNTFFFLLVSVHSLVLPWLPVILQSSGQTSIGIGVVMACVVVASLLSVKLCLVFVTATRSGAVRRFSLFFLLISSLTMYTVSIAILPEELIYNQCSQDISDFNSNSLIPNSTRSPSLTPSKLLLENSSSLTNGEIHTPAFSSMTTRPAFAEVSTKVNTSTEESSAEETAAPSEAVDLLTTNLTKATTRISLVTTSSTITTPSKQSTSAPEWRRGNELKFTPKETSENIVVSPNSSSFLDVESTLGQESTTLGTDVLEQQESPITVSSLQERFFSYQPSHRPFHKSRVPNSGQWLSLSGIEDKEDEISTRRGYSSRNIVPKPSLDDFRSSGPQRTIPLKNVARHTVRFHNGNQEIVGDGDDNYRISNPRSNITLQGNDEERLNSQHYSTDSKRKLFRFHINSLVDGINDDDRTNRDRRLKRSIKLRDKKEGGKNRFNFNMGNITIWKDTLLNNNSSYQDEELGITKDPIQVSPGYTWLFVSILVVCASLLGSGIETSVTRLWHCYSHGYHLFHNRPRHDGGGDDLLERTLTDTFELSACGEHYGWSRVLAGCVVVTAGLLLALGCQIGLSPGWSLSGQAGLFTVGSIFTIGALLTILPVPYGSIKPPKMSRPLSLYLDDEVLWEGLRRIACPAGAAIHGMLCALPAIYGVLILDELSEQEPQGPAIVVVGVVCLLVGEGATTCCRRKLSTVLDSPGLVGLSLGSLAIQLLFTYALGQGTGLWFVAGTWLAVGASQALIVISTRQNALMLATIRDQEREAWVSWCSGRLGTAAGAVLWPVVAAARWGERSLHRILVPVAAATAVLAVGVAVVAVLTRSRRAARRRVYHTLDLNACDADDEDQSDEEEDWLVKGARKEGLEL